MRIIVTLCCALLLCSLLPAQPDLTTAEWREDLSFLRKTIYDDFPFLFKKVSREQFDAAADELHAAIPELQDHEVTVGLARLVSLFGYGHTGMSLSGWHGDNPAGFRQLPLNLYYFSDGIHVQGVHRKYSEALGARVVRIGKLSAEEALEAIRPVVEVENEQYLRAFGLPYLGTPEILHAQGVIDNPDAPVTWTLEKDGRQFTMDLEPLPSDKYPGSYSLFQQRGDWLEAREQDETPLYISQLDRRYFFTHLKDENTVYVRQSQVLDEEEEDLATFWAKVFDYIEENEVDRLILDVRLNGGGNNYKNKPVITGVIRSRVNEPGKFFVIIGRRTFSAAMNLVNELDNYTEAIFVGEPTSENVNFYGDNRTVTLPNSKLPVYLSFAWWQDKPQWENADWLAPDLAVDMSFEQYRTNQDPVLEAILNWDGSAPPDPIAYFTELFMTGQAEKIGPEARRMMADPAYRYYPFENRFNRTGYQLLNTGRTQEALFVFGLNSELFPDSPNVWDSLAEAHWKAGQTEEARQLYRKAIAMDPDGPTAENARSMLERMDREK